MTNETTPTPSVFLLLKEDGKVYVTKEPVPVFEEDEANKYIRYREGVSWHDHLKSMHDKEIERLKAQAVPVENCFAAKNVISAQNKIYHEDIEVNRFYEIKGYEVEFIKPYIWNDGHYQNVCIPCKQVFMGAKLQRVCEKCCETYEVATLRPVEDKKEKKFMCSTEFVPAMPWNNCSSEDPIIRKLHLYPHGLVTTDDGKEVGQWATIDGKIVIMSSEI